MGRSADDRNDATERLNLGLRRWLDAPDLAPALTADFLALADEELGAFLRSQATDTVHRTIVTLIERSHRMLATAPRESVTLSRLATRICSLYFWSSADEPALQGDAWREHAAALLSAADYVEADAA